MYVHCGPFRLIFGCCGYLQSVGVHLVTVQRHTLPRPVGGDGGRRVGLLEQVALCLAQRRRRFVPLGSGGASARSAAAAILLARRRRSRLARRRRRFDSLGGGAHGLRRRHCFCYCRQPLIFGPGFGFCGTTLMVVLARSPGCPSRPEPAWTQGFPFPADNFPNELSTCL